MSGSRALEWLQRRHAGESVALIARRDGVSTYRVRYATGRFGPFPTPTMRVDLSTVRDTSRRNKGWVEQRRRGVPAKVIAAQAGVSHQYVSQVTGPFGPFPSRETVAQWVADRSSGVAPEVIAATFGAPVGVIERLTAPAGPFPSGRTASRGEVVGVCEAAREIGVSRSWLNHLREAGTFPDPDFVTAAGRHVWLRAKVLAWVREQPEHLTCPQCGRALLRLALHVRREHPTPR